MMEYYLSHDPHQSISWFPIYQFVCFNSPFLFAGIPVTLFDNSLQVSTWINNVCLSCKCSFSFLLSLAPSLFLGLSSISTPKSLMRFPFISRKFQPSQAQLFGKPLGSSSLPTDLPWRPSGGMNNSCGGAHIFVPALTGPLLYTAALTCASLRAPLRHSCESQTPG